MKRFAALVLAPLVLALGYSSVPDPPRACTLDVLDKQTYYNDGAFKMPGYQAHVIGPSIWRSSDDPVWNHQLHSLPWLLPVLKNDANEALRILHQWQRHGRRYADAWSRHTAARRTGVFLCAYQVTGEAWVLASLEHHTTELIENYAGDWNHGFDQSWVLLDAGCALGRPDWIEVAVERLVSAVPNMVDREGVSTEQAAHYHRYTYERLGHAVNTLQRCGLDVPRVFRRREKMPAFTAHATRPDGVLVQLGDTPLQTLALEPQPSTVRAFRAGYLFWRSDWTPEARYLTLRFGAGRRVHGHNDHTSITYFAHGTPILVDSGFDNYNSPVRDYFRSPEGHNVVYLSVKRGFRWNAETVLLEAADARFVVQDQPYPGVTRRRTVEVLADGLMVTDRIQSAREWQFVQAWHLGHGFETDGIRATNGQVDVAFQHAAGTETEVQQGWVVVERGQRARAPVVVAKREGQGEIVFETRITVDVTENRRAGEEGWLQLVGG